MNEPARPTESRAIECIYEIMDACGDSTGDLLGLYQVGHWPPWDLRSEARYEHDCDSACGHWPRREWWQSVPYSLVNPDSEPCGGEEADVFVKSRKGAPEAFPVTVLYLADWRAP